MSRAAFILEEMPIGCWGCPLCKRECIDEYLEQYEDVCILSDEDTVDDYVFAKPDWCPLVEMPKELVTSENNTDEERDYMEGWNSCLLEIEKRYELNMDLINEDNE